MKSSSLPSGMNDVGSATCTATVSGASTLMLSSTSEVYSAVASDATVMLSIATASASKSPRVSA